MQFTCDQCMERYGLIIWQIYLHFSRIMFPLGMPTCFCFKQNVSVMIGDCPTWCDICRCHSIWSSRFHMDTVFFVTLDFLIQYRGFTNGFPLSTVIPMCDPDFLWIITCVDNRILTSFISTRDLILYMIHATLQIARIAMHYPTKVKALRLLSSFALVRAK